jgi:hypothetical protein
VTVCDLECDLDKTVCCLDELLWTLPIFKCPGLLLYVVRGRVVCMWTLLLLVVRGRVVCMWTLYWDGSFGQVERQEHKGQGSILTLRRALFGRTRAVTGAVTRVGPATSPGGQQHALVRAVPVALAPVIRSSDILSPEISAGGLGGLLDFLGDLFF